MVKFFYKEATIAILLYDISRYESFNALRDFRNQQFKLHALKDIVIGIAYHKADKCNQKAVPESSAREFANSI